MSELPSALSLNQQEKIRAEAGIAQLDTITATLCAIVEKTKDSSALDHLTKFVPWLGHALDIAGEALPPIKSVAKFLEKTTTINDPLDLGMIACTASYHQACIEAISLV